MLVSLKYIGLLGQVGRSDGVEWSGLGSRDYMFCGSVIGYRIGYRWVAHDMFCGSVIGGWGVIGGCTEHVYVCIQYNNLGSNLHLEGTLVVTSKQIWPDANAKMADKDEQCIQRYLSCCCCL